MFAIVIRLAVNGPEKKWMEYSSEAATGNGGLEGKDMKWQLPRQRGSVIGLTRTAW
jgi:hypothetical protein